MKEIDIKGIIEKNFGHRMSEVKYKEYPSIYDALHSSEYRKVAQRNFGAISEGFKIAEIEFCYLSPAKPIPMRVVFQMHFDFEYAERKSYGWKNNISGLPEEYPSGNRFSVKPVLGIDEISIDLDETSKVNKEVYKLLDDNIPHGGGSPDRVFKYYCISGMHCEGHQFYYSRVKLDKRIANFFNYLFGMVDEACDYQEYPERKPKIVQVQQTSCREDEYELNDDYFM